MARNKVHERGVKLQVTVASGISSGDPVEVNTSHLTGVALNDRDAETSGKASVQFEGVFNLSVKGINDDGNIAGVEGQAVYFVLGDTPKLSLKSSGKFFGYLLEELSSGATATIKVLLGQAPMDKVVIGLVDGGSAGDHTLAGVALGDRLVFVGHISTKASIATLADITSEFTISATDTLNNGGGTDTSSDQLFVFYMARS